MPVGKELAAGGIREQALTVAVVHVGNFRALAGGAQIDLKAHGLLLDYIRKCGSDLSKKPEPHFVSRATGQM